jgi:hypothetical protein
MTKAGRSTVFTSYAVAQEHIALQPLDITDRTPTACSLTNSRGQIVT